MGLMTGVERSALLDIAAQRTHETSFIRQLAQQDTIYDHQRSQSRLIDDLAGAVAPPPGSPAAKKKLDVKIVSNIPKGQGFHPNGYYHHLAIDFALGPQGDNSPVPPFSSSDPTEDQNQKDERDAWGTVWQKDLINPRKSCVYFVRCTLQQLRVEPLLGGFILHWTRPIGWAWVDGQGPDVPVQVASNPLVVERRVLTPATRAVNGTGFSVKVKRQYP